LPFVWWQLGNRQIFDNILTPLSNTDDIRLSQHTLSQALYEVFHKGTLTYNCAPLVLWMIYVVFVVFEMIRY
jgi:hypothetical protein